MILEVIMISVAAMYTLLAFIALVFFSQGQAVRQSQVEAYAASISPYSYAQGGLDWTGLCATGQSQAPIDILTEETVATSDQDFSAIAFDVPQQIIPEIMFEIYPLYALNGTLWAVFEKTPWYFTFFEVHYHIPAQQLINGVRYAAEIHVMLVSTQEGWQELTLVLLFQEGQRSPFFDNLLNGDLADFYSLLPSPVEDYFYYVGSREVPTPDCYEDRIYVIINQVWEISAEQIEQIRTGPEAIPLAEAAGHGLYRETQPLNGRTVYHRVPDRATSSFLAY